MTSSYTTIPDKNAKAGNDPRTRRRPIAVFTPELHEFGGTERATVECIRRWAVDRDVLVFTRSVNAEMPEGVRVFTARLPRSPHLIGWAAFYGWATLVSIFLRLRPGSRRPIVFSPGVNLFRADVTVAHIFFRQFFEVIRADERAGFALPARLWDSGRRTADWRHAHSAVFAAVLRLVERGFYRRAGFVFAVSELEADAMRSAGIPVAGLSPNGVDGRSFAPLSKSIDSTFRILSVGSEITKKGLDVLLIALSDSVLQEATSLTIVTRRENAKVLSSFARTSGYKNLHMVTNSPAGPELFRDIDVYVAASREDSFNMPALEAMSSGIPVVMTRRCGLASWAEQANAALLIDPTPRTVADALKFLLEHPTEREELAARGQQFAAQMTWDVTVESLRPALEELDASLFLRR